MNYIKIGNHLIGRNHSPFIIAEMSGNHNQSLDRALELVDAAAYAGAHALKLQTYTADTITMKGVYSVNDKNSLWNGKDLYDLYSTAHTPWEWHKAIFDRAKEKGLTAFSAPFDLTAVDFLEKLNVPCYKIASFENTDYILLKKVAQTGKPVIISTGVSNISEIEESVEVLRKNGCKEIILLKCTSTYPASAENTNLLTIPYLMEKFNCNVGLSDHTMGIGVSVAAVALGASVIEKHFTLQRSDGGVDAAFSMEPAEMKLLVDECQKAFFALGKIQTEVQPAEEKNLFFKRSLYVSEDINQGEIFTEENIRSIRPSLGLSTKHYLEVLGKKAKMNIKKGTPLSWEML
ncbi:MAG: pseudaminic acid synthase [Bacteroidia bacterium]